MKKVYIYITDYYLPQWLKKVTLVCRRPKLVFDTLLVQISHNKQLRLTITNHITTEQNIKYKMLIIVNYNSHR